MRWMFVSNYLQMMHEQLKMTKQISWMLEWIILVNYICKDDQYPWPWCKLVQKYKNMINEDNWDSWTNEMFFDKWSICFFARPPHEKYQKLEKCQTFNFDEFSKYCSWCFLFYLRNIIYLAKILWDLLSNKNGILHLWKNH